MKPNRLIKILLMFSTVFLFSTCSEQEEFKICSERCPSSRPWRVESLDLEIPCFVTKEACIEWAKTNGYSDKPCIVCA